VSVHDQCVIAFELRIRFFAAHLAVETTLRRIVFEQIGEIICGNQVVQRNHLNLRTKQPLFDKCPKDKPPDSPKAVNSNFRHVDFPNKFKFEKHSQLIGLAIHRQPEDSRPRAGDTVLSLEFWVLRNGEPMDNPKLCPSLRD
jgi:hypothetical protein